MFVLAMESLRGFNFTKNAVRFAGVCSTLIWTLFVLASVGVIEVLTDFGGFGVRVTPVPIPNTEVKPDSADGTWGATPWESRTPPDFSLEPRARLGCGVLLFTRSVSVAACGWWLDSRGCSWSVADVLCIGTPYWVG